MNTLVVKDICGSEVLSRSNVRKLYDVVDDTTETIDMSGVSFISRSVADELCNLTGKYPQLRFDRLSDDVCTMLDVVRKGRTKTRILDSNAKISTTVNCKTMDDLKKAFLSFGVL